MKRVIGLAVALVVLLAAPASAHVSVTPDSVNESDRASTVSVEIALVEGESTTIADDEGADGTDPATFIALALGGMALVAALAALVMGRKRIPA